MKPDTALAFVVLAIGLAVATAMLPRFWKHKTTSLDRPQPWWLFGGEAWRAAMRIMPISIIGGWVIVAGGVAMWLQPAGETRSPWAPPLAAALLLVFILIATIWFWNQPKSLVPPHLRNEPGTLSGIFGSRRRSPPSRSSRSSQR